MLFLAVLIFLVVTLYILLKVSFENKVSGSDEVIQALEQVRQEVEGEGIALKGDNLRLRSMLDETVALYDITREICRSLDENRVFAYFKEQVRKYVHVDDCLFLKTEAELSAYKEYSIIPLEINKVAVGYLAVSGLRNEDKDKFYILSRQCLLAVKRAVLFQRVQELAITDSLTSVFTRKHFMERFQQEIDYSGKYGYPLSFLMVDIDYFKSYNDRYGHLVGDAILRAIAKMIKDNLRQVDLLCRYGGEEFAIILTNTDKEGAKLAAERIRQSIEAALIHVYDEDLKVTVSVGIAVYPTAAEDGPVLIEAADNALYKAKESGRNRVCV